MNEIEECEQLAKSYAIQFKNMGKGHVQFSGHGVLVNYWPTSKRRTVHVPETSRRETNCTPYDAVRICLQGKSGHTTLKSKAKISKKKPSIDLKPLRTNPAGLKHFYDGDIPPWEEEAATVWKQPFSDGVRMQAYELEQQAMQLRADADELDELEPA